MKDDMRNYIQRVTKALELFAEACPRLVDRFPEMREAAFDALLQQDALLVAERLLLWKDKSVRDDLSAYPDVNPEHAIKIRDLLLNRLERLKEEV